MYADADRLIQVVVNLLSNAIKFSSGGDSVILNVVAANGQTKFSITDKGGEFPTT